MAGEKGRMRQNPNSGILTFLKDTYKFPGGIGLPDVPG